jgi:hypothetical protein
MQVCMCTLREGRLMVYVGVFVTFVLDRSEIVALKYSAALIL